MLSQVFLLKFSCEEKTKHFSVYTHEIEGTRFQLQSLSPDMNFSQEK